MKRQSLLLVVIALSVLASAGASQASDRGFSTLDVNGEQVRIYRDEFGVPHIFAETNRGLFEGYGYVVAQDRLWQLELFRRAARGRLAEVFGPGSVNTDIGNRIRSYTAGDLNSQLASRPEEEREIIDSYADGINRYLTEVVATDPAAKLPFEFHYLGLGVPEPWTVLDVVAIAVYQTRFGQVGGTERNNQTLLTFLRNVHGPSAGLAIFNDLRWLNDPDAPTSVPAEGAIGKRHKPPTPHPDQLLGASESLPESEEEQAEATLRALGIPTSLGSHGWAVSPARSADGSAMLFGGPQNDPISSVPEVIHEVQLKGGNGFNVTGIALAGQPAIIIGRTDHIAWTLTSGVPRDNADTFIETLCGGGTGYLFNGVCTPYETRVEVINVRGSAPVNVTLRRSVHGVHNPPASCTPTVCFTLKRAYAGREIESFSASLARSRAHNLDEFAATMDQEVVSYNFLYADRVGNIAYWGAGQVPVRPAGFDPRLPFPGDGSAEWPGGLLPIPTSINPAQGWLANWNSKPSVDWDTTDQRRFGRQDRLLEIEEAIAPRLAGGGISLQDMREIATDIAGAGFQGGIGRESRFIKPYLLAALDADAPSHPLADQARAVLETWDGSLFADAVSSTSLEPGQVIFAKWLELMLANTFGDELGAQFSQANAGRTLVNVLIHALDDALGTGSGVPPSRDYFNGVDPNVVMSEAFDQALAALGPDPAAWSAEPRGVEAELRRNEFPTIPSVGTVPTANRATYGFTTVLSNPTMTSESILAAGQSGFIGGVPPAGPVFDAHFSDQLELYLNFQYKPMRLYRNTQLQE